VKIKKIKQMNITGLFHYFTAVPNLPKKLILKNFATHNDYFENKTMIK